MKRHPISGAVAVKRDGPRGWHWVAEQSFDPALHQPHDPEAEAKAAEAEAKAAEAERLAALQQPEAAPAAEAPAAAPAAAPARKRAGSTTPTTEA